MLEMFKCTSEDILGESIFKFIDDRDKNNFETYIAEIRLGKKAA